MQKKKLMIRLGFMAALGVLLLAQTKIFGPRNLQSSNIRVEYANEGVTGTTVNKLAKLTGAPSTAIITATTDTSGIIGIVVGGAGTTGNAQVAVSGKADCVFDSATTAGHYVLNDTSTAGDCMDGGATYPTSGQVIGVVLSTNGGAGTYTIDLSLRQPQAGGAGGISSTYGAVASLPATCATGDLYRTSDSIYEYQCTALNTWTSFYKGQRVVPPPSTGWSWDDGVGGSTIHSANGYEYISVPQGTNTNKIAVRYRTAPSTPYTVKFKFIHNLSGAVPGAGNNNNSYLSCFRDSAGKIITWEHGYSNNWLLAVAKYTNSSTLSAYYTSPTQSLYIDLIIKEAWMALSDTGTNLVFYWSLDGLHWHQLESRSRTDFFASGPNAYGFGAWTYSANVNAALISLEETASATP